MFDEAKFSTMPIRAILFDLDDTLAVDEAVSHESFDHTAALAKSRFGIDPIAFTHDAMSISRELWASGECRPFCREIGISAFECLWGGFDGESNELTSLRNWSRTYRREVFQRTLTEQLEDFPAEAAELLSVEFAAARRSRQRLMPGAREIIAKLSPTYRIALLTNGAPDLQREKIEASGLGDQFHAIAISGEYGIGKPNPEIFHRLLAELHISPEEALMVGNSLERDISGARNAGIRSIWIKVPGSEEHANVTADHTITSLSEISGILEQYASSEGK